MKSGTRTSRPVSRVASLVTPPLAVSPRTPGSVDVTVSSTCGGKLHADWRAVVFLHLNEDVVDEKLAVVAEHVAAERQGFVGFLIHEVIAAGVGVEIRRRNRDEIRFRELLTGLEGLVEYCACQQVPHFDAHERLTTAGGGL